MDVHKQIGLLTDGLSSSSEILTALGDPTRQHLILEMLRLGDCNGVRVNTVTEHTNLSRPAVSRHLGILKKAGIVKVRKEGTKNYYYFDPDDQKFKKLIMTLQTALEISGNMPDRSEKDY